MTAARVGVALSLSLVASACNPFATESDERMTVDPLGHPLTVVRDATEIEVRAAFPIRRGDVIETDSDGARVSMEADRTVHLAPFTRIGIVDGATIAAKSGALVADASADAVVMIDDVEVRTADGTVRVERDRASAEAATLRGAADLYAPGQGTVALSSLFRSAIVVGEVLAPRPYRVDPHDPWDLRYLSGAVELEYQLDRYAGALGAQLRGSPSRDALAELLGHDGFDLMRAPIRAGVGAVDLTIGLAIATTSGGPIAAALERAFGLRGQGAQWGVVAALMDVPARPLLAELERLGSEVLAATESGASGLVFGPGPGRGGDGASRGEGAEPGGVARPEDCDNVIDCTLEGPAAHPSPEMLDAGLP